MTQDLGPLARELSLPYYEDALPAHDRFHARRVRDTALRLATDCEPTVDRDVLAAAAWLHDVGRPLERDGTIDDHDRWAADEAIELLESKGVSPGKIDAIEHCIRAHSIRSSSPEPETIEAKLIFDADKLDATGARGIVRLACIVGERSGRAGERYAVIDDASVGDASFENASIDDASTADAESSARPDVEILREWAEERLELLYTPPARRLGESRRDFMDEFFAQFEAEIGVDGER